MEGEFLCNAILKRAAETSKIKRKPSWPVIPVLDECLFSIRYSHCAEL
jgi:hypothetical protein